MDRCPACTGEYYCIMGDGPSPCRAMLIGQNPGKTEEAQAARGEEPRVFVGDAGRETNEHYLALAGLTRSEDVYVTNVMKCHTSNDRKPSPKEIAACSRHFLPAEIAKCRPDIIVLMGAPACSIVPEIDLETHRGYPRYVELFGEMRWVFPVNHPAAGMHDTSMMSLLMEDFSHLREVLGGDYSCPVDEYPNPDYRDLTGDHETLLYILGKDLNPPNTRPVKYYPDVVLARDTEYLQDPPKTGPKTPWCSTFTIRPGTGYMIRAADREGLRILGEWVSSCTGGLHNALADLDVEEAMGLPYNPDYEDTMQLASHQGDLPQGLKPLAWRLCGMTMQDYNDIVMPYSRTAVLEYLEAAFDIASMRPGVKRVPKKRKIPKTDKAFLKLIEELKDYRTEDRDGYLHYFIEEPTDSELAKKLLHIFKHASKPVPTDGVPYDPWDAYKKQVVQRFDPEEVYEITRRLGDMPKASIEQVFKRDPAVAIRYACRDSDATRRVYDVLKKRAQKYYGRVMLGDIDR